jgi:surface carbohydrate biosynthesis protein
MIKKITYTILNLLFFSKIIIKKPLKKKYLIIDGDNSEYITKYIKKDYNIIFNRFSQRIAKDNEINIYLLFKMFFKFKFNMKEYVKLYIKYSSPKIVITLIDNNIFFYEIESKKKFKKIAIQNAFRTTQHDIFQNDLSLKKKLSCDYILTFNYHIGQIYQKYIKCKIIQIGSFRSNASKINNDKKIYDIIYVSSYKGFEEKDLYLEKYNITYEKFLRGENKLIKNIVKFINEKNYKLYILGCKVKTKDKEIIYWKKKLNGCKYSFIPQQKNRNTYKIIDRAKILICIDSTLGYESISRGNKICIFSVRPNKYPTNSSKFGWPDIKLKSKDFFRTDSTSYSEFKRVVEKVILMDRSKYFQKIKKEIIPGQIIYNKDNILFKNLIKKINNENL